MTRFDARVTDVDGLNSTCDFDVFFIGSDLVLRKYLLHLFSLAALRFGLFVCFGTPPPINAPSSGHN